MKMYFVVSIFLSLDIFFNLCYAIMAISANDSKDIMQLMVDIIVNCFSDKSNPIIYFGNQSRIVQLKSFYLSQDPLLIVTNSLKNDKNYTKIKRLYKLDDYSQVPKPYPATKLIMDDIEVSSLKAAFYQVRNSISWDSYAFYIIKNTLTANSCDKAYSSLKIAWDFDILSAVFICYDSKNSIEFYSFNPFSNEAPYMWQEVQTFVQANGHPFTLFKLNFQSEDIKEICDSLDFDKTKDLGGYPVKILAVVGPPEVNPIDHTQKVFKVRGEEGRVAELIWTTFNASVTEFIYSNRSEGVILPNGTAEEMVKHLLEGTFDYFLTFRIAENIWKNQMYFYKQLELCYLSKKKRLSVQDVILNIILNKYSGIFVVFYFMTGLVLKLSTKATLSEATLDILRLFLGVMPHQEPQRLLPRIVLFILIILSWCQNSFYQGKLYSAITVPTYADHPKTEEELAKSNYKIYTTVQMYNYFLPGSAVYDRINVVDWAECTKYASENNDTLCIEIFDFFNVAVRNWSKIHLTVLDNNVQKYIVYIHRDYFYLHKRLGFLFRSTQETGLLQFIADTEHFLLQREHKETEEIQNISLHQMIFSFIFLMYGLVISAILFFIEFLSLLKLHLLNKVVLHLQQILCKTKTCKTKN